MLIFFSKKNLLLLIIYLQILDPYEMAHCCLADLANIVNWHISFLSIVSELHRESVFCPSIPYTLMNTSLRRSNFVTSFNYRKFYILEIQLYRIVWVRRFTIRVSFDWVQNGDHRHANALSINYRTLIALFVIIFRSISNRHPMRIGLHLSMFIVRFMIRGNAHPLSRSWNSSRDTNQ